MERPAALLPPEPCRRFSRWRKASLHFLALAGLGVMTVGLTGLLTGCADGNALSPKRSSAARHPAVRAKPQTIAVLDEGWHTGVILPVPALDPSLAGLRKWFPTARYLVFGWGDRRYYMAAHPGVELALGALFPSASVVLVQGIAEKPQPAFLPGTEVRWICISARGMGRLDTYLARYLETGAGGRLVSLGRGPFPNSRFFASPAAYDAFHTCNTWTAAAMHNAGLPVNPRGVVLAGQVMAEIAKLPACASPNASPAGG